MRVRRRRSPGWPTALSAPAPAAASVPRPGCAPPAPTVRQRGLLDVGHAASSATLGRTVLTAARILAAPAPLARAGAGMGSPHPRLLSPHSVKSHRDDKELRRRHGERGPGSRGCGPSYPGEAAEARTIPCAAAAKAEHPAGRLLITTLPPSSSSQQPVRGTEAGALQGASG